MIKIFLSSFILFLLLIACSDESTEPVIGEIEPTFSDIYTKVISVKCATSGCHVSTHPNLDMSTKMLAYTNLFNKPSSQSLDYIEPGEPDNSYLYIKITDDSPPAGLRMPRTGPPYLSDEVISTIREWIVAGALNN